MMLRFTEMILHNDDITQEFRLEYRLDLDMDSSNESSQLMHNAALIT